VTSLGQVGIVLGWLALFVAVGFAITLLALWVMSLSAPRVPKRRSRPLPRLQRIPMPARRQTRTRQRSRRTPRR